MNALQAAWDTYQDNATRENLDAFIGAAIAYQNAGGVLPQDMAGTFRLSGGAQGLPTVVVTGTPDEAKVPTWALLAAIGFAVLALSMGDE